MRSVAGRILIAGAGVALTLGASGCTRSQSFSGYIADASLTQAIQPGVDNRASVLATLGRPTFDGQFDDQDWYYVSRQSRQYAFSKPTPTSQTVLRVRFDEAGNVAAVDRAGLEQVASISPSGETTPTLGRDRSFFDELFGNIGRVGSGLGGAGNTGSNTGTPN